MSRPLIIRIGALGDTVMTLPLIQAVAASCGQPCDIIGHHLWAPAIYGGRPEIGDIRSLRHTKLPAWLHPGRLRLRNWLAHRQRGPLIIAESRDLAHHLMNKLGYSLCSLRDLPAPPHPGPEHQIDILHRLGQQAGLIAKDALAQAPQIIASAQQQAAAQTFLAARCPGEGPLLCLQLGSNYTMRRGTADRASNNKWWPLERWVETLRQLREQLPALRILALGASAEAPVVSALRHAAPQLQISDGAGCSLPEVIGILSMAQALLSVDTGIAHIAAACDCPTVVLFGAADPRVNRPWARHAPVHVLHGPQDSVSPATEAAWAASHRITDIGVSQVLTVLRPLLDTPVRANLAMA